MKRKEKPRKANKWDTPSRKSKQKKARRKKNWLNDEAITDYDKYNNF